jgi:hypothetical protein
MDLPRVDGAAVPYADGDRSVTGTLWPLTDAKHRARKAD